MQNLIPRAEFLLQSLFLSQNECPHCGTANLKIVFKKHHLISIKKCLECHLYFTSPIYKKSRVASDIYGTLYEEGWTTRLPALSELDYLKETKFESIGKNFSGVLERMVKCFAGDGNKLLEIGSGWGYFLFQAWEYGFDAIGVEINAKLSAFGKKHLGCAAVGSIEEMKGAQLDIGFLWHALEHFTDLTKIFRDLNGALKPRGHLFIAVPNFDWDQFGEENLSVIGAIHPLGFSSEFFLRNLPRHGFSIQGLFDDIRNFPDRPCPISTNKNGIIVWARKEAGG